MATQTKPVATHAPGVVDEFVRLAAEHSDEIRLHADFLMGQGDDGRESGFIRNYLEFLGIEGAWDQAYILRKALTEARSRIEHVIEEIDQIPLPHYVSERFDHLRVLLRGRTCSGPAERHALIRERIAFIEGLIASSNDCLSRILRASGLDRATRIQVLTALFERHEERAA